MRGHVPLAVLLTGFSLPSAAQAPADRSSDMGKPASVRHVGMPAATHETGAPGGMSEAPQLRWGVQLAGSFSRERALAAFAAIRANYPTIIGDSAPVVIDTPYGNRGPAAFYRVRLPAASRIAATELCDQIRSAGGSCVVLSFPLTGREGIATMLPAPQ